ncbi:MAG: rod shape-determining protein [Clostridiales bacterium]|nr:rod shape-determining protein [Clostridiales bacterium]
MLGINIGIDLGTTAVVIFVQGKGIVLSEPTAAAYNSKNGKMLAVGKKAYNMLGKNPSSIRVVLPIREGVVSDFSAMQNILRYHLQKICGNMVFKPNILICLPSTVTNLEKRTILDLAISAGAGKACLIEEPLAAALGAGVEINRPKGVMVVDIGGGSADIAVLTMGSISVSKSIKTAGNAFDAAIMRYFRRERDVIIGDRTAEKIKMKIGCAYLRHAELAIQVKGKNYITGMPAKLEVSSTDIYLAIREQLELLCDAVRSVLESTPPELSADIAESGIILTGGGALLRGMDELIKQKTGVKTSVAEEPLLCVAKGIGKVLKNSDMLSQSGLMFKTAEEIRGYKD